MGTAPATRIRLCGPLEVQLHGRLVDQELPGRQGRLVLAFLAARRQRPVARDELIDALWPREPPADPDDALSALLSKVRRALGKGVIQGRRELTLVLPSNASVDLEDAHEAAERADAALARSDWRLAFDEATIAVEVASGGFLKGHDAPWVEERRREVEELRLRALECLAAAGAALGGAELAAGERAARGLIDALPFRESGYRFLMAALAARGNVAEALHVYDELRVLLRDELGTAPGAAIQALHERLLTEGRGGPGGAALVDPLAVAATDDRPSKPGDPTIAASLGAGGGEERRLITVLCAELAVERSGQDPEQLRSVLAPRHARVRTELERCGGTLDRFVGGAVLAVFGAPVAHEDDPERAVRAALRLLELSGGESSELGPAVRVGVATGEALVTLGASPLGGEGLAQGQVVAAALGLQRAAGAGTALVDDATARSTRRAVGYEQLSPGGLEGHPQRRVWRALRTRERVLADRAQTPLVGRGHELAWIERLHRTVIEEQRPRLVAIVGEPGIGKTRLTNELVARIGPSTAVHRGRCLPYGEGITYWALREIIWSAAGILLDDSAATAESKLGRLAGRLIEDPEDAEQTAAALARTAGIALGDGSLDATPPESVAEVVGLAWPRFLGALVRERPAVVVVEDLHWAEASLLDILERLVSRTAGPLLIVATARPEFAEARPSWSSMPGMSQVGLEPLTEPESRELVENLLPGVTAEVVDRVAAPAEGNPFFAEEIVRHITGEGSSDAWRETASTTIPNSVRALIASRIDALPEGEKRRLQDAAVVGRTFWATSLESMAGGAPVAAALRALEVKGFVVASPTSLLGGQPEYAFSHALKREVAYRSIPRARRARVHAAVAAWIEEVAADRQGEFVDLIAYHHEAAATPEDAALAWPDDPGERERVRAAAVRALLAAGEAARSRVALDDGLRFADRARALSSGDVERLGCLELHATVLHAAVRSDEAFAAYRQGLELAGRLQDDAAVARLRAHAALLCARYSGAFSDSAWRAGAVELVRRGLAEVGERTVSFEAGALLLGRSVIASRWIGQSGGREEAAEEDARRALEIAEAIDSPYLLLHAVEALIGYASLTGFCDAAELGERLAHAAEKVPSRADAHEARISAAISLTRAGRYDRARELAREATRESMRMSPHRATHAASAEAHCLAPAGRFEELIEVTPRVADVVREEDGRLCQTGSVGLAGRALALFERGHRAAATEALELFEGAPPPQGMVHLHWLALDMLRPLAGPRRTRQAAARVDPAGTTLAGRVHELRLNLQLSALLGEWSILDELLPQAKAVASRACAPPLAYTAAWAQAVQRAALGDGEQAISGATRAARDLERHGEAYTAVRLLTDLLPFLDGDLRAPVAELAAARLNAMGAVTSAKEATAAADPAP
jgi:DNA-binding SARP family transcriptional activator/class 3 adenylate cyclase/tetratricopeptide (TPR) repeat protein